MSEPLDAAQGESSESGDKAVSTKTSTGFRSKTGETVGNEKSTSVLAVSDKARGRIFGSPWMVSTVLIAASAALWGSSKMTWFAEFRDAGVRGSVLETRDGAQQAGALVPLAVVALAGVAGFVAAGRRLRKVLALILVLAGVAAGCLAVRGIDFRAVQAGVPTVEILVARGLALVGGILLFLSGLMGLTAGNHRSKLGAKYNAPSREKPQQDAELGLWEALSHGEDPTIDR